MRSHWTHIHIFIFLLKKINTAPISTLLFANMQCALLEKPQKNQVIFHCFVLFMKWKWELWDEVPNSSPSSIHLPCKNVALVPGSYLLHLMNEEIEGFIPTREWNTRTIGQFFMHAMDSCILLFEMWASGNVIDCILVDFNSS